MPAAGAPVRLRSSNRGRSNETISPAHLSADSAFSFDYPGPGAGAERADAAPGNRRAEPAGEAGSTAVHAAADRPAGRADRALSRPAAEPGLDGGDLPATGGR